MDVIKMGFPAIIRRFPTHKIAIKRLFQEDETFLSICKDYEECSAALKRWNESSSEEALERRREYVDLLEDLEQEMLQYVTEHT